MNRFVILALVAAAAVSARTLETLEGASRGLKTYVPPPHCTTPKCEQECSVKTTVIVGSDTEFKCVKACEYAVEKLSTQICKDATGYLVGNQNVTKTLNVVAHAVGQATAVAAIEIFSGVSYKGNCAYGSMGIVHAKASAQAFAKVVAKATAQALVKVYGENALGHTYAWIDATSIAITKACATAIVEGFLDYTYSVGPPSAGWVTYTSPPVQKVATAVAKAVANAYVEVVAKVTIDVDAHKFPCDFVCPKCPPL